MSERANARTRLRAMKYVRAPAYTAVLVVLVRERQYGSTTVKIVLYSCLKLLLLHDQ